MVSHRARQAGRSLYGVNNRLWVGLIDILGVPDRIFEHASRAEQLAEAGLDATGIAARARALAAAGVVPAARTA